MKINLKLNRKVYNAGAILTVLFIVLILAEAYVAYTHIYRNLTVSEGDVTTSNVVRVNLTQYGDTIEMLDEYESYYPGPNLTNKNPFQ